MLKTQVYCTSGPPKEEYYNLPHDKGNLIDDCSTSEGNKPKSIIVNDEIK